MNKTQIFNSYSDFLNRTDEEINGVDKEFAEKNPDWENDNATNKGCWNCSDCRSCSSCSDCSYCSYCIYCSDCRSCSYCSSCRYCRYCRYCSDCSSCSSCSSCRYCSDCSSCSSCSSCRYCSSCRSCRYCSSCSSCRYCSDCSDCSYCIYCSDCRLKEGENSTAFNNEVFDIKIKNIHQKVFKAANKKGCLEMDTWHTCDTTHCRAGWVVHLAGKQGYELEKFYGCTWMAAQRIYNNSSEIPVGTNLFFVTNEEALEDMKQCAKAEKELGI